MPQELMLVGCASKHGMSLGGHPSMLTIIQLHITDDGVAASRLTDVDKGKLDGGNSVHTLP